MLFYLVLGAWIDGLMLAAGARMTLSALVAPVLGGAIVTTSGELLLTQFRVKLVAGWLSAALVAGTALTCVVMLIPTWVLHLSGAKRLPGVVRHRAGGRDNPAVAAARSANPLARRRHPAALRAAGVLAEPPLDRRPADPRRNRRLAGLDRLFRAWHDHRFVRQPACDRCRGHHAAGHEAGLLSLRHVQLPAALSPLSGLSGLALAAAAALPLGLLLGLCGLYALAAASAGIGPAFLSVWIMACMPDASHFLLHNGFYGFHWLMFTAPGAGYAIGTAAIAHLGAQQWFAERRALPLLLALLLTATLITLRAHMFLLLAPALVAAVILAALPLRWRVGVLACGLLMASVLSILLAGGSARQRGEPARFRGRGLHQFRVQQQWPAGLWRVLAPLGRGTRSPRRRIAAAAGDARPLGDRDLSSVWSVIRREFRPADWIPGLLCLVYLLLIIWAPPASNGDIGEYKHPAFRAALRARRGVDRRVVPPAERSARWLGAWRPMTAAVTGRRSLRHPARLSRRRPREASRGHGLGRRQLRRTGRARHTGGGSLHPRPRARG